MYATACMQLHVSECMETVCRIAETALHLECASALNMLFDRLWLHVTCKVFFSFLLSFLFFFVLCDLQALRLSR